MHIIDDAVCDDEKDEVLLVSLVDSCFLSHITDKLNDWRKVGWAIEVDVLQCALVCCCDSFEAIDFWVKYVSIESKAVGCPVDCWWDSSTIAKDWDLLLRVVVLQNVSAGLDCLQVLVPVHVKVVE